MWELAQSIRPVVVGVEAVGAVEAVVNEWCGAESAYLCVWQTLGQTRRGMEPDNPRVPNQLRKAFGAILVSTTIGL
jgi:hypothetical protein